MMFWIILGMSLVAVMSFPIIYALTLINIISLPVPWFVLPIGVTLGTGAIVMMAFLYYPYSISGGMKTAIEKNIVYIINYMSILAGAGVTTEAIFTSLAEKGEIYKVQDSAKAIVRDVEVLGKDIITAIDDECMNTPSRKYSKLLLGLNGVTRTGGNLVRYFRETANRQMSVRRRELSKLVSQLNLAAEAYVVLGIAFPVILTTLLSMMGIFGGDVIAGLNPIQIMNIMTYLFFPLAAMGVLLLIDGMTSSW
jgi:flagellar protein FlaJ